MLHEFFEEYLNRSIHSYTLTSNSLQCRLARNTRISKTSESHLVSVKKNVWYVQMHNLGCFDL